MAVYAQKVGGYTPEAIQIAFERGLKELGVCLDGKRTAVIKPNLVRPPKADNAMVTHPAVVEAVVDALRGHGFQKITVAERSSIGVNTMEAFERAGYRSLAERKNVTLADMSTMPARQVPWRYGSLEIPVEMLDADLYVAVPKMKTHFHTTVTLSIKNQWGLLPPAMRQHCHQCGLHEALIDLAKATRPHLIVMDGIEGMEGEGPTAGSKVMSRVLVVGQDLFEMDVACCRLMGIDPHIVRHLQIAYSEGLWQKEPVFVGGSPPRVPAFKLPSEGPKRRLNFYAWRNDRACSLGEHAFEKALHVALHNPRYWFTFMPKFFMHVVLGRMDLIRGPDAEPPPEHGAVLYLCDCTKTYVSRNGTVPVPGCPPRPEDVLAAITRMPVQKVRR